MTEMPPYLTVKDEEKNSGQTDSDSEIDDWDLPLSFDKPRHLEPIRGAERVEHSWRVKEKYKTHCVALVLCLNVGVDPPDVVKTQPCARLECWIDPVSLSPSKALESIGHALQAQYERWQPRARYKHALDPTSDEVKKLCCSLRRNAKDERVLFHYNGHGVPRPTAQGEIWVFNRAYTQYIPLSMYDLQTWMGAPSLYVYDCSSAGVIVENFNLFADQHEKENETSRKSEAASGNTTAPAPPVCYRNCIQLAACAAGQTLPMHPELPADLFTACLTTPVKMAMKWFVLRHRTRVAVHDVHDLIDKIPGQVTDRRTMLGELNWIFTAITDTIAWSSLPAPVFQQLFRADLLTASLCRNFLLADRIMRSYNCTPVSAPALPSLANHALWAAWDQTLDLALAQLPALLGGGALEYRHSPFFRDQLTAFQVWLDLGSSGRSPPAQLPMVLQVLLSTLHRVRALQILCRFLALGGWAVRSVLHVGIFPYMLKLLQASAPDLRPTMVYIWAKIVAQDPSCQVDLVNAKGHKYFLSVLQDPTVDVYHRTLAAFVLAGIVDGYPLGQEAALQGNMISACLEQLCAPHKGPQADNLKRWSCIALARLWQGCDDSGDSGDDDSSDFFSASSSSDGSFYSTSHTLYSRYGNVSVKYDAARWAGVRDLAHEKLYPLLSHPQPEVRAATAFALGTFMAAGAAARTEHANAIDQQVAVQLAQRTPTDASPIVRAEILAALQWAVLIFEQHFIAVYLQERMRRSDIETRLRGSLGSSGGLGADGLERGTDALAPSGARTAPRTGSPLSLPSIGFGSVYTRLWSSLCGMAREPHPQISKLAESIIKYVSDQVDSVGREIESRSSANSGSSTSLPPSPNTRPDPVIHTNTLPAGRRKQTLPAVTTSEDSVRDRDSSSSCSSQPSKKPIVQTAFVDWCVSALARPETEGEYDGCVDPESRAHHERVWRYKRNKELRREARSVWGARVSRLEAQAFHSRCPLPPAVVLFHPYDQHLAVASKDNFGIWDWGTAAKLCVGAWRRAWGRITALSYINAHHHPLLCVASATGNIALYRPMGSSSEPALVSAWRALSVRQHSANDYRPPPAQPLYSLAQLVSEQFGGATNSEERLSASKTRSADVTPAMGATSAVGSGNSTYSAGPPGVLVRWAGCRQSLALCGPAPCVRLWDASTELLTRDINTETDAAATSLWRGGENVVLPGESSTSDEPWLLACGFADGSVRVWDERAGAGAATLHDHTAPVLCAARKQHQHTMLTGCVEGYVRLYDTRKMSAPAATLRAPGPLAALAVHPLASVLACGSVNQCISVYDLRGNALNTIKFHEGFMGARIGPVSCLAFHPLRVALGVGSKDSTVSVYVSEARR